MWENWMMQDINKMCFSWRMQVRQTKMWEKDRCRKLSEFLVYRSGMDEKEKMSKLLFFPELCTHTQQPNQPRWAVRRSSCEWVAQCFPSCRLLQACFHKYQDMRENILLTPFLPHSSQQKKEFFWKKKIHLFLREIARFLKKKNSVTLSWCSWLRWVCGCWSGEISFR